MTFDYTCPHCGARETYQLVPMERESAAEEPARPLPTLDFTCASCGATDTFQLVKS
jgi:protein-disulfide isomerase